MSVILMLLHCSLVSGTPISQPIDNITNVFNTKLVAMVCAAKSLLLVVEHIIVHNIGSYTMVRSV